MRRRKIGTAAADPVLIRSFLLIQQRLGIPGTAILLGKSNDQAFGDRIVKRPQPLWGCVGC